MKPHRTFLLRVLAALASHEVLGRVHVRTLSYVLANSCSGSCASHATQRFMHEGMPMQLLRGGGSIREVRAQRGGSVGGKRVQLHRALSKLGLCSRSLAWQAIKQGRVCVNSVAIKDPLTWVDVQGMLSICSLESIVRTFTNGKV